MIVTNNISVMIFKALLLLPLLLLPGMSTVPSGWLVVSKIISQVESSTESVTYRHLGNDTPSWFVIKT
jgi:hypothetical protein